MNLTIPFNPNPLFLSSSSLTPLPPNPTIFTSTAPRSRRRLLKFRASATADGGDGSSWLRRGSQRFWVKFGEMVKKETGLDLEENGSVKKIVDGVKKIVDGVKTSGDQLRRFGTHSVSQFVEWNTWERWKNFKNWEPKRIGALVLYVFVVAFACRGVYIAIQAPYINREKKELAEAYMEALIPEPSPTNIKRFKKGMWKKTMPKGLKMKKLIERPDGTLVHDTSYVGEDAWEDDQEDHVKQIIDDDVKLNKEEKKELTKNLGISGEVQAEGSWRERLNKWREILRKEHLAEQLDSLNARYVVEFDMKEVEKSLLKDVAEKVTATQGTRALWIAKRWWRYRPKLPYTYFLDKLDSSEVAAVVFTEDLKRLYVTMKEGFPLEFVVSSFKIVTGDQKFQISLQGSPDDVPSH